MRLGRSDSVLSDLSDDFISKEANGSDFTWSAPVSKAQNRNRSIQRLRDRTKVSFRHLRNRGGSLVVSRRFRDLRRVVGTKTRFMDFFSIINRMGLRNVV